MGSDKDIVERLESAYKDRVVCHCGDYCKDHGYTSNHTAVPNEDGDDAMLREAAATIKTLRAEVRAWRTQDHNLVNANADQYVVRVPRHVPITSRVLEAIAATDSTGALGKEGQHGQV